MFQFALGIFVGVMLTIILIGIVASGSGGHVRIVELESALLHVAHCIEQGDTGAATAAIMEVLNT